MCRINAKNTFYGLHSNKKDRNDRHCLKLNGEYYFIHYLQMYSMSSEYWKERRICIQDFFFEYIYTYMSRNIYPDMTPYINIFFWFM